MTPQPSGRRYRSLRNHSTRFRNSHYPSIIRKEVQEPQEPFHQVQEQSLPLNHQEGGTGASGPTPPGHYPSTIRKEVQEPQDPLHQVITPQPSGRRYRSLRTHSTRSLPLNHQEGGTGASGPTPPGHYPSTIRKEVQEPQNPLHQVITPQPSGRRYRSLRTHSTRSLPLNHQEGGTGASGPTPPGYYPQPSGRRYRSLRAHSTRSLPLNHQEGGAGASGPTPPGHYPSTIRKEVQEPQDPLHQVITPQPSGRRYRSLRAHSTRSLPLNHQEGGAGASGPTPPGSGTVITPNHQEGGTGASGPTPPGYYPQPSGRRYRSLRAHSTRSLPLNHQEGGTGASGPTELGSGTVITPQPSGSSFHFTHPNAELSPQPMDTLSKTLHLMFSMFIAHF
ncbi:basic proline-rich protein-like isoform X7 [Hypanus sabinus]|uniref:basic proline-rich protein-like isoform X7 n=1 Tax=Hypanus sabinus TaxID=79690 RepID=UPI0028C46F18|nr:basic proline-rich protein-like isoform X7 [Hypanus sabinus]